MSAREWQPGDVAMVERSAEQTKSAAPNQRVGNWEGVPILSTRADGCWIDASDPNYYVHDSPQSRNWRNARPLVVIDPEDREQVERLRASLKRMSFSAWACGAASCLTTALREFANPTPPRIDEPGVWGVVTASCSHSSERRPWMRHEDLNWYVVGTDTKNNPDDWDSLIDPVLVREGVTE